MILIKIFSSFGDQSEMPYIYQNVFDLINLTYKHYFKFVTDDTYTHAIILNTTQPKLKDIPKEHVLGFSFEPYEYLGLNNTSINYMQKYVGSYQIGNPRNDLPSVFKAYYGFQWHVQQKRNYIDTKKKCMSIIFSHKTTYEGHKYRHILINEILTTKLPIDIYGNGCKKLKIKDERIKGEFTELEPYTGYQYSIAIENNRSSDYITEKFTNCIAMSCIPVYYGATNVEKYFGSKCYHRLTGNVKEDMKILTDICEKQTEHMYDLSNARHHLYNGDAYLPNFLVKMWCN